MPFTRTKIPLRSIFAGDGKRYMPMKLITFIFLSMFCSVVSAEDCLEPFSQQHEAVTITPDSDPASGMYHVRVPREFDGMELRLLILSATMKEAKERKEISLPLAIKTRGELTGSFFYMSSNWLNVRVAAKYGEGLCTELVAEFSM